MTLHFLFIILSIVQYINGQQRCYNQSSCITYGNVGSSCEWLCVDGCIELSRDDYNNLNCVNKTSSAPVYSILFNSDSPYSNLRIDMMNYSTLISFLNSLEFMLSKTDYRINYNGSGISCPYGCMENNKECIPINTNYICYPQEELKCPYQCIYNSITNSCTTDNPNIICETNTKYKVCPYECYYNNSNNKCYSKNPNIICNLGYQIQCPYGCTLNYNEECVSDWNDNNICHHIPTPKCPDYCSYDFNKKQCISNNKNSISYCEPYIYIYCKYGYDLDLSNIPYCNNNLNDICIYNGLLTFPLKMIEKYKDIKCKYSDIYCYTNYNGQFTCNKGGCGYYVRECIL
jgi:hypothetical protein